MGSSNSLLFFFFRFFFSILPILFVVFLGYSLRFDIPVEELQFKYAPIESGSLFKTFSYMEKSSQSSLVRVHYRDEGPKNAAKIIALIHGTASSLHTWDHWAALLKLKYRVIRFDLPGFGLTGPSSSRNYTLENYASFVHHFLLQIHVPKVTCVVGNSLGANIALIFAGLYPEMTSSIALLAPGGIPTLHYDYNPSKVPLPFRLAQIPFLSRIFLYITPKFMVTHSLKEVFYDQTKVTDELIDRHYDLLLVSGNRQSFLDRVFILSTVEMKQLNYYARIIKSIQCEVLLLWGDKDTWTSITKAPK